MLDEYHEAEPGLTPDKHKFDLKVFKKQIKEELEKQAAFDPEKAKQLEEFIFDDDHEINHAMNRVIPEEEIKYYPGSIKGPEPEDDPEFFAKWYVEN